MPPNDLPPGFSFQEEIFSQSPETVDQVFDFVDPTSVAGLGKLRYIARPVKFVRRLYKVQGLSIKWFAVVVPDGLFLEPSPHVYFIPSPEQGKADDGSYDQFAGAWRSTLYVDYTKFVGAQVANAREAQQVLVIPFYRNSQRQNLGDFNQYWQPVITQLLTDAIFKKDVLIIRKNEVSFDSIYTSSFSNGWVTHQHFQQSGKSVADLTIKLFDLDGVQAGSSWAPAKSIIYKNRPPPGPSNPVGNTYFLDKRWGNIQSLTIRHSTINFHWMVNQFMLFHGLVTYARRG